MVSLLAIGANAAINAIAFSGTNYIFSKFSDHGEAERKRRFSYRKITKGQR